MPRKRTERADSVATAPRPRQRAQAVNYRKSEQVLPVLLEQRNQLERAMNLSTKRLAANGKPTTASTADGAQERPDENVAVTMIGNTQEQLDRVGRAIQRIREGTYGECVACGKEIPIDRLRAFGGAVDDCIKCRREAEHTASF